MNNSISNNFAQTRADNFSAGPSLLPTPVVERIMSEAFNYQDKGFAVFEISHRSDVFQKILERTITKFKELTAMPDDFQLLFIHGGATLQYSMIPANFLNGKAGYIETGHWSKKAATIAQKYGEVDVLATSADRNYSYIPAIVGGYKDCSYVHLTSNNTIYGTQWHSLPSTDSALIIDSCSDFISRPLDYSKFKLSYGSTQKNFGISGTGYALISKEFLNNNKNSALGMLGYSLYSESNSLHNTPNTLAIYVSGLMCDWLLEQGGLSAIEKKNKTNADLLYGVIDHSQGFYTGFADKAARSLNNITFKTRSADLDQKFVAESSAANLIGLKGHRQLGGLRASCYNSMPLESVERLASFMEKFKERNA